MKSEQLLAAALGVALIFAYFGVFQRSLRWALEHGNTGRVWLTGLLLVRQLLLGLAAVGLWAAGVPWQGLMIGVLIGAALYRVLLVASWAHRPLSELPTAAAEAARGAAQGEPR